MSMEQFINALIDRLDDDLHNEWKNANVLFWEIDDENNMYLDVEKRSADL